jgi:hypothetical protein
MQIIAHRSCEALAHASEKFIKGRSADIQSMLQGMTLHMGPSSSPEFRTPAHARDCLFVGDSAHIGNLIANDAVKALYKQDPKKVSVLPRWNSATKKWDVLAVQNPSGVFDAAPDLLAAQSIAPWNQSWFQEIFDTPLLYSHASELVKKYSGTEPWAEVMNLMLADYQGFAFDTKAGTAENSLTKDINVKSGIMTAPVINIFVTYSLTVEETARAEQSSSPYGSTLISKKIQYADYVLRMITDFLTYYGNAETGTEGIFDINAISAYGGTSIANIVAGASTSKGSLIYQALAGIVDGFFTAAFNKFDQVRIGMSTYAYNKISSVPYSDVYSAKSPLAIFEENYIAGQTKDGKIPRVKFYPDPLLDAATEFNAQVYDYMVITAPEIGLGPEDTKKSVILQGMPLENFVYPVIPGMVNTQHRVLRRYAGIFAPVLESVKVISGFGK